MDMASIVKLQRSSTELIVYCRLAGRIVTVCWPVHNGLKIVPTGIKSYNRNRGCLFECFCAFTADADTPLSCQIVESLAGEVLGHCHFDRPRCEFKFNFSVIYRSSQLTSTYHNLPNRQSGRIPDMDTLLVAFTLTRFPTNDIAPHFEGYFGEHTSCFPSGAKQLSGPTLPGPFFPCRRLSTNEALLRNNTPYRRHQKAPRLSTSLYYEIDEVYPHRKVQTAPAHITASTSHGNAVAGPSRITLDSISQRRQAPFPLVLGRDLNATQGKEEKVLKKLMEGQGVSEDAWDGLIEKCTKCKHMYTSSVLKHHIKKCLREIVVL
ncbi:hypothetical protein C8R43DRAFT_1129735 [Mycena crocata]|nr:hypothetical protein C8R43DRAFT_1129735 [Mycena crocata]